MGLADPIRFVGEPLAGGRGRDEGGVVSSEGRARVGLSILLLLTLFSFAQVFAEGDYPGPVLLGMMLASVVAMAARRLGLWTSTTVAVSAVVLFFYLVMIFQARNSFYLLPSPDAISGIARSIGNALRNSSTDFAPVPVRTGYVILVVIGMWAATTIGEIATVRWRRPLLAAIPCIVMFCIQMTVGTGTAAPALVIAFLLALLTFWGLESAHRVRSWGRWVSAFPARDGRGPAAGKEPESVTGALARRMGAGCVAAAVVAPMIVPALGDGLLAWRNEVGNSPFGSGGGSGEVNPFVSIAPQLIDQTDEVLFTVEAERGEYWRLLSLAEFDGEQWEPVPASESVEVADAEAFPRQSNSPSGAEPLVQRVTFEGLESAKLPAALNPVAVDLEEERSLTYDGENQDLTLDEDVAEGFSYTVVSNVPQLTYDELREATVGSAGEVYEDASTASEAVTAIARDLRVADNGRRLSDVDFLIALQDHLRRFEYDITPEDAEIAETGGSVDFLERFLVETQRGYCQQFATAFALLARLEGIPTRVAVGFLPGSRDLETDDRFVVTGLQTHAWPEVYFEGYGWVRFDPTPRSEAVEPRYTREPVDVGNLDDGGGPGNGGVGAAVGRQDQITDRRLAGANTGSNTGADRPAGIGPDGRPVAEDPVWERAFDRIALGAAIALLAFLASVPALKTLRIRRRYRRARGADGAAAAAFAHFEDEAAELATPRGAAESAASYVARLAGLRKVPADDAAKLASIYEAAEYGPHGVRPDQAGQAKLLARKLRGALWSRASWLERAARLFSPRRLVGRP
ncbi:MAG TPA: DUF3488 and transglutaminase-like domain-containing protein [Actinomycetota bacterium]|nr:DUF3488 and transglutaminase-like domain-containing protein [Actinomycetota bacterium]